MVNCLWEISNKGKQTVKDISFCLMEPIIKGFSKTTWPLIPMAKLSFLIIWFLKVTLLTITSMAMAFNKAKIINFKESMKRGKR